MSERVALNLKRFWDDQDVKDLLLEVHEDIVKEWEGETTKEKREERHSEIRALRRLIGKFRAKCEHADAPDTRKLRT